MLRIVRSITYKLPAGNECERIASQVERLVGLFLF
jgi:hypothetical protein